MKKYIDDGRYIAKGHNASVYQKENGNVILLTEWEIPSLEKTIRNWDVLILGSTNEIKTKTLDNIKKWATGWDGVSLKWFSQNIESCEVELVIANEPMSPIQYDDEGEVKTVSRIKWINPLNNSPAQVADESDALDKIFSARLRAISGCQPVAKKARPTKPAPAPAPAPKLSPIDTNAITEAFYVRCESMGIDDTDFAFSDVVTLAGITKPSANDWNDDDWRKFGDAVQKWNPTR